jgi:hypothetical protein
MQNRNVEAGMGVRDILDLLRCRYIIEDASGSYVMSDAPIALLERKCTLNLGVYASFI